MQQLDREAPPSRHEVSASLVKEGSLLTRIPALDAVLQSHEHALGADSTGYRNHCYRVVNLCVALSPDAEKDIEKLALAAAYHDIAIWTSGTFDYLQPSIRLADEHLGRSGQANWAPEINAMICEHHKIFPYRAQPDWLVEPFRKADLIDVSKGFIRFGLRRDFLHDVNSRWPSAGFHKKLVRLTVAEFQTHPLRPLPMLKL
jgi:hypothetical protein